MADECKYYTYKEGDYHCLLVSRDVNGDWVHRFCWGYHCSECPFYKEKIG